MTSKYDSGTFIFCYIGSFLFLGASAFAVVSLMPDLQLATSIREGHINSHNADSVRWTIEPLKRGTELKQARLNVLHALLIGALGLAIANLGKSSAGTLSSYISYFGAPLRVRPLSAFWPGLYIVGGVMLIGSSYETIFDYGKPGSIYFNGLMQSLGYMLAQIGLGSIFSAVLVPGLYYIFDGTSFRRAKQSSWDHVPGIDCSTNSMDATNQLAGSTPPPLPVSAPRLPYCPSEFRTPKYQDPLIIGIDSVPQATSGVIPEEDKVPAEILGRKLNRFQVHEESGEAFYQLYLGCSGFVLFEQAVRESISEVRLCSLLADGMIVVTTHSGSGLMDQSRQGSTALVQIIESDSSSDVIIKLLDAHLTKCEKLKASRGTHVQSLLREDAVNAWLYARRAVAEMRFQCGLSKFEVLPIEFGRFSYPNGVKPLVARVSSLGPSSRAVVGAE